MAKRRLDKRPKRKSKPRVALRSMQTPSDKERRELAEQVLKNSRIPPRPPLDFDLLGATPAELKLYGLPPKPKDPERAVEWGELMSDLKSCTFVEPTFKIREERGLGLSARVKTSNKHDTGDGGDSSSSESGDDDAAYHSDSSVGAVVCDDDAICSIYYVKALWVIPDAAPGHGDDQTD
jgi:hypothetical protein